YWRLCSRSADSVDSRSSSIANSWSKHPRASLPNSINPQTVVRSKDVLLRYGPQTTDERGLTMDCRKAVVLALSLLTGSTGCVGTGTHAPPLPPPTGTAPVVVSEKKQKERMPKAETWGAWGEPREGGGENPKRRDAERQLMFDRARKPYQQAREIAPKHLPAYEKLARLYLSVEDAEKARAVYQK